MNNSNPLLSFEELRELLSRVNVTVVASLLPEVPTTDNIFLEATYKFIYTRYKVEFLVDNANYDTYGFVVYAQAQILSTVFGRIRPSVLAPAQFNPTASHRPIPQLAQATGSRLLRRLSYHLHLESRWNLLHLFSRAGAYRQMQHSWNLEMFWVALPTLILCAVAVPSIYVLYLVETTEQLIQANIKVIGHQWYWSYEIADCTFDAFKNKTQPLLFDSFMIPSSDLVAGQLRLLEVDRPLYLPINTPLTFLVTSTDVIHSWSVPSLGIKIDAIPGRLNRVFCEITRVGEFYGQCSELCGINHGFMPIKIISYDPRV